MSPRKVAEKLRKRWGKALYIAPNKARRQHLRVVGDKHVLEHHVATDCGAHPHRIPLAGEGHTRRVLGNLEIQGALDPRLLAEPDGRGGVIRGAAAWLNNDCR